MGWRAPFAAPASEQARAFATCLVYVAGFEVSEDALELEVELSLYPQWVGTTQVRQYLLDNGELVLRPPPVEIAGQLCTRELRWLRDDWASRAARLPARVLAARPRVTGGCAGCGPPGTAPPRPAAVGVPLPVPGSSGQGAYRFSGRARTPWCCRRPGPGATPSTGSRARWASSGSAGSPAPDRRSAGRCGP